MPERHTSMHPHTTGIHSVSNTTNFIRGRRPGKRVVPSCVPSGTTTNEISMSRKKETLGSAEKATTVDGQTRGFTDEEQAAMKARAREVKEEARANKNKADGEKDLLAAIEKMSEPDRALAMRLHEIIQATAPELSPKTWYGMPAYASDGKVVCFFQSAQKFKSRYATLGFTDAANLDDGTMWPVAFGLKEMNAEVEARIVELVRKAVS